MMAGSRRLMVSVEVWLNDRCAFRAQGWRDNSLVLLVPMLLTNDRTHVKKTGVLHSCKSEMALALVYTMY